MNRLLLALVLSGVIGTASATAQTLETVKTRGALNCGANGFLEAVHRTANGVDADVETGGGVVAALIGGDGARLAGGVVDDCDLSAGNDIYAWLLTKVH